MSTAVKVRVRMYQVGFGDCFLISVEYDDPLPDGRAERHILIDYGSTHPAREHRARGRMSDVAALIEEHTHGVLDVLALTHRHKDHLSGLADNTGGATIRGLSPRLVLRPWTEDPALQPDATGPGSTGAPLTSAASAAFVAGLAGAQAAAERLQSATGLHRDVPAAAVPQLKNAAAIKLLDELSGPITEHNPEPRRGRYLFAGCDPGLGDTVPGLTVTVLGPPTVEQDPDVANQRSVDKDEFWMLRLGASLDAAAGPRERSGAASDVDLGPGPVRWLVERLAGQRSHSAARLVQNLDDALNNTSLVLLLEIGELRMLFPGDAQIENWEYTLSKLDVKPEPALRAKLRDIDLYKVGHHGSRNATPRSLYALWKEREDGTPPMTILMSTCPGVHGDTEPTRVPRATLVEALKEVGQLLSTDDLDRGQTYLEVEADATGGPFRPMPFGIVEPGPRPAAAPGTDGSVE